MAVILGIDPGTRIVGWGVVETDGKSLVSKGYGAIDVRRERSFALKLRRIYEGLSAVIADHSPTEAALESVFSGANPGAAIKIGEGRGVALVCAANHDLPVWEFAPRAVKKAVVGRGGAHKSQVQEMVRMVLGLDEIPRPDDAADALAVAVCRANRWIHGDGS
jgi:crossover junction endodeoxyribonuclease RuvC